MRRAAITCLLALAACGTGGPAGRDPTPVPSTTALTPRPTTVATIRTTTQTAVTNATTTAASTTSNPTATNSTTVHPPRTRCRTVAHIGDSLTVGMMGDGLAPEARLDAQYGRVGANDPSIDGSGGRSIVEALAGQVNAYDTALAIRASGFTGCWVLQLGTNDAANVSAGSSVGLDGRIDRMMALIGSEPVLWPDATSRARSGDYSTTNMRGWNEALARAVSRYPNLRVFAWSGVVRDDWFVSDGVHYTNTGYAAYARALAEALAAAFPG